MSVRLGREFLNPVYVARKTWLYGRSRLVLGSNDVMIALFPKTGSTWLRFMLYHYLSRRQETATFDEVNTWMPEYGHPSLLGTWPFAPVPRFIKTHRPHSILFGDTQALLLVRDPRDIMVSLYYYARAAGAQRFQGTIGDLLRDRRIGLVSFFEHFRSWAPRAGMIVRYEDLKANAAEGMRQILEFAGVAVNSVQLAQAIELSSVANMRKAQEASRAPFQNHDRRFAFVRAARSAQWIDEFGSAEHECYQRIAKRYEFDLYPVS